MQALYFALAAFHKSGKEPETLNDLKRAVERQMTEVAGPEFLIGTAGRQLSLAAHLIGSIIPCERDTACPARQAVSVAELRPQGPGLWGNRWAFRRRC
jgi:hypothetical protein